MTYKIKLKNTPYYLGKSHKALDLVDVLRRILYRTRKQGLQMVEYFEEDGFAHIKIIG
jgi:hypothetical protein